MTWYVWPRLKAPFQRFASAESASGVVLLATTALALAWANSPWAHGYHAFWERSLSLTVGGSATTGTLHQLINDGLMTVFFFLVGMEIKRETLSGELASIRSAALPMFAALGGMLVPAALYYIVARGGPASPGWGVPMATDIAFALGVLALLGDRVPTGLKGSGPESPLIRLERALQGIVAFGIVPLFALANAGVSLSGAAFGAAVASPVAIGVMLGLLVSKPLGIATFSWLAVRLGFAALPSGVTWPMLSATGVLGGIGFTMSLFIASLAFADAALLDAAKVGVLMASTIAGVAAMRCRRQYMVELAQTAPTERCHKILRTNTLHKRLKWLYF